ncbi:hypothetical protein [Palleronia caenipelagi]|uniref:Uncharacterized protein n=1 Tax=Palleronia caenipelagi TaxID=2489174 RepID=A0A547PIT5_9RHOB|nr:hypothetical protein [Palleronia caenipelagi]TRD13974.1 hypothetical protein FEV53_19695 [Palleronia caenipelagi]
MKIFAALAIATTVVGCSQANFESEPVVVPTEKGPVTCQLYGHNQVVWDKAILMPNTISDEEAHEICINEGTRRLATSSKR